jgi:hypothetical protein
MMSGKLGAPVIKTARFVAGFQLPNYQLTHLPNLRRASVVNFPFRVLI